jgi:hypothetical protein
MTWAARYAFCDPLWRGRTRLIVDAELEAVLRATVERRVSTDAPWRTLVEALVPRERSVATWMVVGSEATARLLAPDYGGVRCGVADAIADRFARLPWETALVTLDARQSTSAEASAIAPARLGVASRTVEAILVDVAAACGPGRIAVVAAMGPGLDYETFVEQLRPTFGEVRVYGGYAPGMFAFAEFSAESDDVVAGELDTGDDDPQTFRIRPPAPIEQVADRWDEGDAPDEEDDPVPLAFDNTLGPDEPPYSMWLGIVGAQAEFGEGLTLVELSETSGDPRGLGSDAGEDQAEASSSAALRRQLQETRKVAELGALERQRLVERIDALEADNAARRDASLQLREQLAGALDPAVTGERLDAALAREQSLRWRVAALERELNELRVRPVEELTAELEALRARTAEVAVAEAYEARDDGGRALPRPTPNTDAARRIGARRGGSGRTAALRVVEALVRRIDRGSIERTSLRRELALLRRRLGA